MISGLCAASSVVWLTGHWVAILRPSASEMLVVAMVLLGLSNFQLSVQRVEATAFDHLESLNDEDGVRIQNEAREPVYDLERRSFTNRDQSSGQSLILQQRNVMCCNAM